MNLYVPSVPEATASLSLSGRFLAHNHLPATRRAFIAADLLLERAHLSKLTVRQAAALCGVSVPYAAAARRIAYCLPHLRNSVERGTKSLIKTARGSQPSPSDKLVAAWNACSNGERIEFAKRIGTNRIWNECVEPAIG